MDRRRRPAGAPSSQGGQFAPADAPDAAVALSSHEPLIPVGLRARVDVAVVARREASEALAAASTRALAHVTRRAWPGARALIVAQDFQPSDPSRLVYRLDGYIDRDGVEHLFDDAPQRRQPLTDLLRDDPDDVYVQDLLDNVAEHHATSTGTGRLVRLPDEADD